MTADGYLVEHGGKMTAVFLVPNYCDSTRAKGTLTHFDEMCKQKITHYEAVRHLNVRRMTYAAGMGGLFV